MADDRRFLADTEGATTDWIVLSAGIVLLGAATIYEVFLGGTNELVSEMNRDLANTANRGSVVERSPHTSTERGEECEALSEIEVAKECDQRVDSETVRH